VEVSNDRLQIDGTITFDDFRNLILVHIYPILKITIIIIINYHAAWVFVDNGSICALTSQSHSHRE